MKKALIIVSVASMIDQFNMPNVRLLQSMGYEVDVAANFEYGNTCSLECLENLKKELELLHVNYTHIGMYRNPIYLKKTYYAYKKIAKMIRNNQYEIIHCQSPIAGVLTRIAACNCKNTTVIYTAHGFHFFKGAPIINWLVYYPIESYCARYTDKLITINEEDFKQAKKFKLRNYGTVHYISGVGIDIEKIKNVKVDKNEKRKELGVYNPKTTIFLSIGELNKNKNHEVAIRALANLKDMDFKYIICGSGPLKEYLLKLASSLGINDKVKLLGYRYDINEICKASDIFIFPSIREGLPVSVMEAMASKLPVICSDIRGNKDLIDEGKGGFLFNSNKGERYLTEKIKLLILDDKLSIKMGEYNYQKAYKYDINIIEKKMYDIYNFE